MNTEKKRETGNSLSELFLVFAKIGMFTFGGGYAMISLIEDICVEKKRWITHDEMMDVTVIAESTPGPIAINCSTFVGYKQKGFPGALAATFGMVLPSFVIIFLISSFLDRFLEIPWIVNAFRGIKTAVGLLILDAGWKMLQKMRKNQKSRRPDLFLLFAFAAMTTANVFAVKISSIAVMLLCGFVSLALYLAAERKGDVK
ncbi:chromate transporter [[Clostridium] aminophilum]|uniref:chromate transporter n=1 Tax=[Clostridium] aminophilum TaxID=1526 RepID=UPI00333104B9